MQLSHTGAAMSAVFDDPNLVSSAGLVPVLALAESAGLRGLADEHLSVPTDKGANPGLKVASLVAGMVAGADSIDDMALLRHGGMGRVFANAYAPSTLGSFLRTFTFGHVRQLDAVACRFLTGLASQAPQLTGGDEQAGRVLVDIDDTIIEVHGHAKQGSGYGYTKVRGLNALLATVSIAGAAPVIVAQRLRKGSCGSARSAGYGGLAAVVRATGISESTVLRGLADLDAEERPAPGNVRRHPGRTPILEREPGLAEDLERLVDPVTGAIRSRRCGGRRRAARSSPRRCGRWVTMSWSGRCCGC